MALKSTEAPFGIYLDSLAAYVAGETRGQWITFPQDENDLRKIVERIAGEEKELMINDVDTREDCSYMKSVIGEWANVYELNTVAQLIGNEEHPAVQAYCEAVGNQSILEVANLLMQEEEIPYYNYKFSGSDNPDVMQNLSEEEKLGHTIIANNQELCTLLEETPLGNVNVMAYIDAEAMGKDLVLNGDYYLMENAYLINTDNLNLNAFTMQEIDARLERQFDDLQNDSVKNTSYNWREDLENGKKNMYMNKQVPMSVYLANLNYVSGLPLDGEWINLPMNEKDLIAKDDAIMERGILPTDMQHACVLETVERSDCGYLKNIMETESKVSDLNVLELNIVAALIGDKVHPEVEAYCDKAGKLNIMELANLLMQEDEITFDKEEQLNLNKYNIQEIKNHLVKQKATKVHMVKQEKQLNQELAPSM